MKEKIQKQNSKGLTTLVNKSHKRKQLFVERQPQTESTESTESTETRILHSIR